MFHPFTKVPLSAASYRGAMETPALSASPAHTPSQATAVKIRKAIRTRAHTASPPEQRLSAGSSTRHTGPGEILYLHDPRRRPYRIRTVVRLVSSLGRFGALERSSGNLGHYFEVLEQSKM